MRLISQAEYNTIATAYNPSLAPNHSEQLWALSAEISHALSELGAPHEGMGGGDFWMNHAYDENRRLSIELSTSKMMGPGLISIIQAVLRRQAERWRIDVMHDVSEMPYFFLLVYSDACLIVEGDDAEASMKLFQNEN